MLCDERGIPLSLVAAGANKNDCKLLAGTLDAIPIDRPDHKEVGQHLCLDAVYAGKPCAGEIAERGYVAHVRPRNVESRELNENPSSKARRWVVERLHSWLSFRKLLVSFEKTERAYLGLLNLACALISLRQVIAIHG